MTKTIQQLLWLRRHFTVKQNTQAQQKNKNKKIKNKNKGPVPLSIFELVNCSNNFKNYFVSTKLQVSHVRYVLSALHHHVAFASAAI